MEDAHVVAREAAGQILDKLRDKGLLPDCGVTRSMLEPYVASTIQAAIGRCVCPPSEGLGK